MQLIFITSDSGVARNPDLEAETERRVKAALASGLAVECICLPPGRHPVVVEIRDDGPKAPPPVPGLKERPRKGGGE